MNLMINKTKLNIFFFQCRYDEKRGNVPTWDYCSVTVTCRNARVMEQRQFEEFLHDLVLFHERHRANPWCIDINDPVVLNMTGSIIGFEMVATRSDINAIFKLRYGFLLAYHIL